MSTQPKTFLTPEEYLEIERKAERKSEYFNGEMFAMSGATRRHCALGFRLNLLIGEHLRGKPCEGFTSDMRVRVADTGLYTYPDLAVVCEEPKFLDSSLDTLVNPSLLVEILSPSTEDYDRGKKTKLYRTIPSLKEYLLISQERPEVDLYRRLDDGTWNVTDASGFAASIELTSIGFVLRLGDLYEGIVHQKASS